MSKNEIGSAYYKGNFGSKINSVMKKIAKKEEKKIVGEERGGEGRGGEEEEKSV